MALCESAAQADEYVELLRNDYYEYRSEYDASTGDEQIFPTSPQGGAAIIINDEV